MIRCVFLGYMWKIARALKDSPKIELMAVGVEPQRQRSSQAISFFEKNKIHWFDARKIREKPEAYNLFSKADLVVVGAFGQILSKELLEAPKYGVLNFHPSLLPLYKGGSPIEEQILRGDLEGGITAHWMTEELDEGPWVGSKSVSISENDNYDTVYENCESGAEELMKELVKNQPSIWPHKEIYSNETPIPVRTSKDGEICWEDDAEQILRKILALGWRGWAKSRLDSGEIVIRSAKIEKREGKFLPGMVIESEDMPLIATGKDLLRVLDFTSSRPLIQNEILRNLSGDESI